MKRNCQKNSSRGFTIVELLVAILVLTAGILGAGSMVIIGMGRNNANRVDTTATNASQAVMEALASTSANTNTSFNMTDCLNTDPTTSPLTVNTAAGGAPVTSTGDIDFTQAAVAGYQINYTVCGSNGQQTVYDVRWNVSAIGSKGFGKLVIVSARQPFMASINGMTGSLVPATLRTVVGI